MIPSWIILSLLAFTTNAANVDLLECEPPDYPRYGGYGPQQDYYNVGDHIHYYCNGNTFISGNFYRKCEDTGDWSGDTPVCDSPATFVSTSQTSTADDLGEADNAVDLRRGTCSSTQGGQGDEWNGNFTTPGKLIKVMIFLPKGPVSYEVVLVKRNGEEVICGSQTTNIGRYDWTFHNCPGPHNTGALGLKVRSLSTAPLQICEIAAYVLTSPICDDPKIPIEYGRLQLDRKTAKLVCESRQHVRSPDDTLQCVRNGQWTRKLLFCLPPPEE